MNSESGEVLKEKNPNKKKIIISIIIVLVVAVGVYFLIPVVKKYAQQRIDNEILKKNIQEGEWLKTQVVPMTEKEKMEIGKKLQAEAKKAPKLTPEKNKEIIDFLKS